MARQLRPTDVRVVAESTDFYKGLREFIEKLAHDQLMEQLKCSGH